MLNIRQTLYQNKFNTLLHFVTRLYRSIESLCYSINGKKNKIEIQCTIGSNHNIYMWKVTKKQVTKNMHGNKWLPGSLTRESCMRICENKTSVS